MIKAKKSSNRKAWQRLRCATTLALTAMLLVAIGGCGGGARSTAKPSPKSSGGGEPIDLTPSDLQPAGSKDVGPTVDWTNVTNQSGVVWTYQNGREANHNSILESLGGGVALMDYDLDGLLDVFAPGGGKFDDKRILGRPSGLFRNLGEMQFEPSASAYIDDSTLYSHGSHVADFDNDGFPDVLVTGYGGLRLYHNQGDGTFLEIHKQAGLNSTSWSSSAGWGDLNGDGVLDLYVCHYVNWSFDNHPTCPGPRPGLVEICPPKSFGPLRDVLYFGNGDGTFRDASDEAGLRPDGKGLGVILADVDLDGDLDVYVANDTTDNFLYLNDGSGKLVEKGLLHSVAFDAGGTPNGSMGVDVGDYNGDLLPDLWVANYEEESFALYENVGNGYFRHVSTKTGIESLGSLFVGFGTAFLDADRDGDEDLVVANGHVIKYPQSEETLQLPLVLINEGKKRFVRKQFGPGNYFSTRHAGRGLATGDLDSDGRLDMVIANNVESVAVLRNSGTDDNQWLQVRLVGRTCNRDGVGAHVILTTSGGRQLRLIKGGGSYESHSDAIAFFGIPKGETIKSLEIHWPRASAETQPKVQSVVNLQPNQAINVFED